MRGSVSEVVRRGFTEEPLTPTLSPEYRGEGERERPAPNQVLIDNFTFDPPIIPSVPAGGYGNVSAAEFYDPETGTWSYLGGSIPNTPANTPCPCAIR